MAQIDQAITVQYGARADEQALRVATADRRGVRRGDDRCHRSQCQRARSLPLNQRVAQNLAAVPGTQTIQDIQADFAGAQASIKATTDRQTQTKAITQTMLDSIEGINDDEVATKILALQTSLQASYQTTAMLYQTSLTKYL